MTNTALIGIAGVHFVVSELSRRGLVALPTVKNTAAYDIVALNTEGTRHANIQVKTSSKRVGFFPMPLLEKIRTGRHDFYVLIRWLEQEQRYEAFLLTGKQAHDAVKRAIADQRKHVKRGSRTKLFPAIHVGPQQEEDANKWTRAWVRWRL